MIDDRLYLLHMKECLELIRSYVVDGRDAFMASTLIQDAVVRRLHTLAESSQRLSESLKLSQPHFDWRGLSGFRNVLVHDYLGVDLGRIWELIELKIPQLSIDIDGLLRELDTAN